MGSNSDRGFNTVREVWSMKKKYLKTICLAAVVLTLVGGIAVENAMAYFTTYVTAKGGYTMELGFTRTEIEEEVEYGKKIITLTNTGDYDCYARLKALTGDVYKESLLYSEPSGAGKWTPGSEGYYYYSDIVVPSGVTTELEVKFAFPEGKKPTNFNVIIIQECTPVLYDEYGKRIVTFNGYLDVGLHDTMDDLIDTLVGALLFGFIGYLYLSNRERYRFVEIFFIKYKNE